jgi:hypothetical protein
LKNIKSALLAQIEFLSLELFSNLTNEKENGKRRKEKGKIIKNSRDNTSEQSRVIHVVYSVEGGDTLSLDTLRKLTVQRSAPKIEFSFSLSGFT